MDLICIYRNECVLTCLYLDLDVVMGSITTSRSLELDLDLDLDLDSHSVFILSWVRDTDALAKENNVIPVK